jgi:GAF domain-containing protein
MLAAPIPANDAQRLAALHHCELLDTVDEEAFDRITRLAQQLFSMPIVLVSLVDAERQWFKSKQGLEASETPRNVSFCGHAILGDEILYVPDSHQDPRFADNPLVTAPPHVRFYAGAPLHSPDGFAIGTLCLIDHQPRHLDAQQLRALRDLADCVENLLLQRQQQRMEEVLRALTRLSALHGASPHHMLCRWMPTTKSSK